MGVDVYCDDTLNCALRIFVDEIERHLRAHNPGAGSDACAERRVDKRSAVHHKPTARAKCRVPRDYCESISTTSNMR
jgi:hypothetical protein